MEERIKRQYTVHLQYWDVPSQRFKVFCGEMEVGLARTVSKGKYDPSDRTADYDDEFVTCQACMDSPGYAFALLRGLENG
jgi:hypothetical protein